MLEKFKNYSSFEEWKNLGKNVFFLVFQKMFLFFSNQHEKILMKCGQFDQFDDNAIA